MIGPFQHLAIGVRNMKDAVAFYTEVFGLSVVHTAHHEGEAPSRIAGVANANLDVCVVGKDAFRIELIEYREKRDAGAHTVQNSVGLTHICFQVSGVEQEYERIKALGYQFFSPPLYGRPGGPKVCYFKGPDNVVIELFEPVTA